MALEAITIEAVPIMAVGGPFHGQGSPPEGDSFSKRDLQQIAAANEELAGELHVPVKLGHSGAQQLLKNSGLFADEMPAAGWLANFRVQGGKLLTDLVNVPKKLADLVQAGAFPQRSVELRSVRSQRDGRVRDAIVTALGLLGAKAPAIRTLDDVAALYTARSFADDGVRAVEDLDGQVPMLPTATADAMERALATVRGRVSEVMYREYADLFDRARHDDEIREAMRASAFGAALVQSTRSK
jgi:hypothetical protein